METSAPCKGPARYDLSLPLLARVHFNDNHCECICSMSVIFFLLLLLPPRCLIVAHVVISQEVPNTHKPQIGVHWTGQDRHTI